MAMVRGRPSGLPVPWFSGSPTCIPRPPRSSTSKAPLDVLHETPAYRIRAAIQLLENIAFREVISPEAIVIHDFALLLAIPLRDGCDVLDVIGRRLQAQAQGMTAS
ncbi:hypothetical protein ACLEJQ_15245 [Pseudomonas sp. SMV71]|uniref:hypothetical protein n=1 Tax=Pseudomonas sp. SMV71 TaxID=3390195 RepID=UPI003F847D9D